MRTKKDFKNSATIIYREHSARGLRNRIDDVLTSNLKHSQYLVPTYILKAISQNNYCQNDYSKHLN